MKTILLLAVMAVSALADEPVKIEKLILKNKKEYEGVTITQKRPDGISILHASGTARIKFEDLPDDVAKQLGGFDPAAAEKVRKESDANQAAAFAEIDKGLRQQADQKAEKNSTVPAIVRVTQSLPGGALCEVAWKKAENQKVMLVFQEATIYIQNLKAADLDRFTVALIPTGATYTYQTNENARATVKSYKMASAAVPTTENPPTTEEYRNIQRSIRSRVSDSQRVGGG